MKQITSASLVVYFAGDSGDGIQLTGTNFAQNCAIFGNDVRTLPDFPAEIRAPQGTVAGVSGFQMRFANERIHTSGDEFDILVALNPAAYLKTRNNLKSNGLLIVDDGKFSEKECQKLNFSRDSIYQAKHKVVAIPVTELTIEVLKASALSRSAARKCKNFFVLGVICWLTHRSLEPIKTWIRQKFKADEVITANLQVLRAGYDFAVTTELLDEQYQVPKADLPPGRYKQMTGNEALAMGAIAASYCAQKPLLMSGYPITPASDILHLLAKQSGIGISTFQAEDEIAAIGAAIGASFAGNLGLTATSGPGMDLKAEALGLAVMTELPLVVVDVQRAGPSTGLPTKVEQSDLLTALYGRHGECPLVVIAPKSPEDCFWVMLEAFSTAVKYMTPVIVLSDANLANSMQAFAIPNLEDLPTIDTPLKPSDNGVYARNADMAREWVPSGTPNKMHRIGGLEKNSQGNISYDPKNHDEMVKLRAAKVAGISQQYPKLTIEGDPGADCLIISWGSTYGAVKTVVDSLQPDLKLAFIHLRHLNPLPIELAQLVKRYQQVIVVELNSGQLCKVLRSEYLVDAKPITQVTGQTFQTANLVRQIKAVLERPCQTSQIA